MVSRESIYYINLKQAYLLSAKHSQRLSSRTVMFTCVPRNLLYENRVRKLFGAGVEHVWIPRDTKDLAKLVEEREQTAVRLEKAQIALIKAANAARAKQLRTHPDRDPVRSLLADAQDASRNSDTKKSNDETNVSEKARSSSEPSLDDKISDIEYTHPYGFPSTLPDVRGSVAAQWVPAQSRPAHRPLANYGRRVDTIKWTGLRLEKLNAQIAKLRRNIRAGHGRPINALFVEFDSQANAEAAYQILAHHRPLHMCPAFIGIRPNDIVWSSLRMQWWERIARRFLMMGLIAAAVIFWSFPSAAVGIVSKLSFLTSKVPFLGWITKLPAAVVGVIEGLVPALALSLLMAAVPYLVRSESCSLLSPRPPILDLGWLSLPVLIYVIILIDPI